MVYGVAEELSLTATMNPSIFPAAVGTSLTVYPHSKEIFAEPSVLMVWSTAVPLVWIVGVVGVTALLSLLALKFVAAAAPLAACDCTVLMGTPLTVIEPARADPAVSLAALSSIIHALSMKAEPTVAM